MQHAEDVGDITPYRKQHNVGKSAQRDPSDIAMHDWSYVRTFRDTSEDLIDLRDKLRPNAAC